MCVARAAPFTKANGVVKISSCFSNLMTLVDRRQRPDWRAYFGSFGDDILFDDADD